MVVEGIRHAHIVAWIKAIVAPLQFRLVFIHASEDVLEARLEEKDIAGRAHLHQLEQHPTEIEVRAELPDLADIIVDASKAVNELAREIAAKLDAD